MALVPVTFNPSDHNTVTGATFSLTNGNLSFTLTGGAGSSQTGLRGFGNGYVGGSGPKLYYEMLCVTRDGSSEDFSGFGVMISTPVPLVPAGAIIAAYTNNGYVFYNGGHNGGVSPHYTNGDVLSCAVDLTALKCWFRKNGGAWIGNGASPDPVTGVSGFTMANVNGAIVLPYCNLGGSTNAGAWTANFGATAYAYTPPGSYSNWEMVAAVPGSNSGMFFA